MDHGLEARPWLSQDISWATIRQSSPLYAILRIMLGYGLIGCFIGGQVLSAVSGGNLTVIVGVFIIAALS
jgi:uncharacterized membrane protein YfcA